MRLRNLCHPRKYASLLRSLPSLVPACRSALAGRLRQIPLRAITNEFAFSFAPEGWNYFRALVAEYEKNPLITVEESTFFRFFQHESIRSVRYLEDVLFLHDAGKRSRNGFKFYLGTYPWGDHVAGGPWGYHHDRVEGKTTRDLYGYRRNVWYQPGDLHPLRLEWRKTIELYHSLRTGYRPLVFADLPQVTLLIRRDGEVRAIRYNGQHRFSILSHLGREKTTVSIPSASAVSESLATWPTVSSLPKIVHETEVIVRETEVQDWPYVKQGLCSAGQALEIFHAFFNLNGRERIACLGLPPIY